MMKKSISLLLALLLCTFLSYGQSKSDLTDQLAKSNSQVDSLTKVNSQLKITLDSVSEYTVLYTELRKKIILYDFKPSGFSKILDSIILHRDTILSEIKIKHDSISRLTFMTDSLKVENGKLKLILKQFIGAETLPAEQKDLAGTWKLELQSVTMIGDSTTNALINVKTANSGKLASLTFIDTEFAEVSYTDGLKVPCIYKLSSFSTTDPYYIDLSSANDLKIRLYVVQNPNGIQVSYKGEGNTFLYGSMKKM